ncbi:MAG: hypothetical protein L0Z55_00310 [Planctomycetes bacterium]|nr:hypothetical protein [Planctomycetota bacterium]
MAAWRDPEADKELVRIAFESGASYAYGAVAKHARQDELDALLAPYSSHEPNKENAVVCALYCLRENKACTPEDRARIGPPILVEVLASEGHAMWRTAAYAVEYDSAYHTPEMAAFLESELGRSRDKDRENALRDALKDVKKTLRKSEMNR